MLEELKYFIYLIIHRLIFNMSEKFIKVDNEKSVIKPAKYVLIIAYLERIISELIPTNQRTGNKLKETKMEIADEEFFWYRPRVSKIGKIQL